MNFQHSEDGGLKRGFLLVASYISKGREGWIKIGRLVFNRELISQGRTVQASPLSPGLKTHLSAKNHLRMKEMWDRDDQMNLHGTSKAHASGRGRNGLERTLFDPVLVSDVWCWSSLDNFHPCFLHHLRWLMNFSIAPKNFHEKKHKSFSGPRLPSRITRGTSSFFLFLSFSGIATDTATEPVATAAAALGPAAAAAAAAATAGAALGQALFALLVHLGDASLPLGDAPSTLFFLLSNLKQSKLKKKKNTTKLYPFFHQFAAQISNGGY